MSSEFVIVNVQDTDNWTLASKQVFPLQKQAESRADQFMGRPGVKPVVMQVRRTIMQDGVYGQYFGYEVDGGRPASGAGIHSPLPPTLLTAQGAHSMSYDVYKDWILIDGRHYWTDHPRWARLAPGWVAIAPSTHPNLHLGIYPASILDADGPRLNELQPVGVGDGLRLSSPHLWVGTIANELSDEDIKRVRYGCIGTLNPAVHGHLLVDGRDQDYGHAIA